MAVLVQYPPSVAGGGGGAPTTAQYIALATDAGLTVERVLTAGTGITLTDAGPGSTLTIAATGGAAATPSAARLFLLAGL
jgi:hypothetical protein